MTAMETLWASSLGASASLTGLLFIALSLHRDEIASSPALRTTARGALRAFMNVLLTAILALIPGQGPVALGLELAVLCVIVFVLTVTPQIRTLRVSRLPPLTLIRYGVINVAELMIGVSAIALLQGERAAELLLVVPVVTFFVFGILLSWDLIMNVDALRDAPRPRAPRNARRPEPRSRPSVRRGR